MSGLATRITTAMALGAVVVLALLGGSVWASRALLTVFFVSGALEWSGFVGARSLRARLAYVVVLCAVAWCARQWLASTADFELLMGVAALWWLIALLWVGLAPGRVNAVGAALAGMLALVPTWVSLLRVVEASPRGGQWALFIMMLAFGADIGAFFAGRAYGRIKLAPRVSPAKTWEGVIGGLLLATVVGIGGAYWFGEPVGLFVPVCIAAAAFSVVGDLTESMLKRSVGMKDSGRLLPGHGGILDRIDSVTAAAPVFCLGLLWLGVLR
jgi:phosphatidate cytidylyltransferase